MKNLTLLMILSLAIVSCKRHSKLYQLTKDGLTVQAEAITSPDKDSMQYFRLRILTVRGSELNAAVRNNVVYRTDSAFSLLTGRHQELAAIVQPIAAGTKDCYEFLIGFDHLLTNGKRSALVYHDRFINKKTYILNLQN